MSRRLMSLICLGMYCLCLWLAVQTVEKVRQISPGVSLRYAQALTGEQVKKAQTYIKSSQNTDGLMVTFWEETQVAVRSPVSTRTCTDVCSIGFCGTAHDAYGASYVVGTAPGSGDTSQCAVSTGWHGSFLEVQTYWSKRLRWTRIQRMPGLTGCAVSLYRKQSRSFMVLKPPLHSNFLN